MQEPTIASDDALCYLSIAELGRGYRARQFTPLEVTDAFLRRIGSLDPTLGTYITVTEELAKAGAAEAQARYASGTPLGPIDGVPIGLKDLFDTAGVATTGGSRQFAERVPTIDSNVVARLREGGAVLLGKHSLYEFASGMPAPDVPFPAARNPWNTERVPGGSSSGSAAAIAAGLCAGAFGSDTGGSIRGPASYCGTVGLKPSAGVIGRTGVLPLSWTLDTVGPITRTVEDAALLLAATSGPDAGDPGSRAPEVDGYVAAIARPVNGMRIGVPLGLVRASKDLHEETLRLYSSALADLERLGARVTEISWDLFGYANVVVQSIITSEAFSYHRSRVIESPEKFGSVFYRRVLHGALLSAEEYITALRGREALARSLHQLMTSFDVIILPTMPGPAGTPEQESWINIWDRTNYMRMFNISGQPAISLPCGFTGDGMPIGLQIAGRVGEDATVLAIAQAYEAIHRWDSKRPPIEGGLS